MTLGKIIKAFREEHRLSMDEFAAKCGISKSYISMLENNRNPQTGKPIAPSIDVVRKVANGVGADFDQLIRDLDDQQVSLLPNKTEPGIKSAGGKAADASVGIVYFPVIGSIAAGYDNLATEEYTGEQTPIPTGFLKGHDPSEYFVLAVKGDSMYPQFLNGDKVLVQRTTSVDSGSIAVIMYNGDEATLKKVVYVYGEDWMELIPINPEYKARRIEGSDLEQCRVLGKVVMLLRDIL
ncbi:MAG: XRE family transcriptional regulator [Bacillota bacterium]